MSTQAQRDAIKAARHADYVGFPYLCKKPVSEMGPPGQFISLNPGDMGEILDTVADDEANLWLKVTVLTGHQRSGYVPASAVEKGPRKIGDVRHDFFATVATPSSGGQLESPPTSETIKWTLQRSQDGGEVYRRPSIRLDEDGYLPITSQSLMTSKAVDHGRDNFVSKLPQAIIDNFAGCQQSISVEIMPPGKEHPFQYARLPRVLKWTDGLDARRVGIRVVFERPDGTCFRIYHQTDEATGEAGPGIEGAIQSYNQVMALTRFLRCQTLLHQPNWYANLGTAKVLEANLDFFTQTYMFTQVQNSFVNLPDVVPTQDIVAQLQHWCDTTKTLINPTWEAGQQHIERTKAGINPTKKGRQTCDACCKLEVYSFPLFASSFTLKLTRNEGLP